MNKFIDINDYNLNMYNNKISLLYKWIIVSIFIIILLLILGFNNNYYTYYQGVGVLKEKDYLSINVDTKNIDKVLKSKKIMIGGSTLTYNVTNISEEFNISGEILYKEITLSIKLEASDNIKNNNLDFKIIVDKTSIFNYMLNKIKGE